MLTYGHGGNVWELAKSVGRSAGELLDFSANINPLGPPEWLRPLIDSQVSRLVHYPDPYASSLTQIFADHYAVPVEEVLAGNGSTEILYALPRIARRRRAVILVPAYVDYKKVAELAGLKVEKLFLREEEGFQPDLSSLEALLQGDEMVFLGQPNNPTGITFDAEALRGLAARHPATLFVIDEAFADFIEGMDRLACKRPLNVMVLCSLTKFYAIPGLRLGCAIVDRTLADQLRRVMPPWSVNMLAQAVGEKALQDREYAVHTRELVPQLRQPLFEELRSVPGLTVYPGEANFLLARIDRPDMDAPSLARAMLEDGIAIRVCDNYDGLDRRFFRVAVRTEQENECLLRSLRSAFGASCQSPAASTAGPTAIFDTTTITPDTSGLAPAMNPTVRQPEHRAVPVKSLNKAHNSFIGDGENLDLPRYPSQGAGMNPGRPSEAGKSGQVLEPWIRKFYSSPMSGAEIERESLRRIDEEAPAHDFTAEQWQVAQRMIHTTADFALLDCLRFSSDAITAATQALLGGRPIYVDSNMIRSGVSLARLRALCTDYGPDSIACHIADEDVAQESRNTGLPRSLFAVRKAKPILHQSIALFGNAPIALLELNRLILEEGIRPALVIAMPVGFVHVVESKQELMTLGVPYIALDGRRGGSPIAVSVLHALCAVAMNQKPK